MGRLKELMAQTTSPRDGPLSGVWRVANTTSMFLLQSPEGTISRSLANKSRAFSSILSYASSFSTVDDSDVMERTLSPVFSLAGGKISWPLDLTTTLGAFGELEQPESSKLEAPRRGRGLTDLSPQKNPCY
jgi:hypothetical protein